MAEEPRRSSRRSRWLMFALAAAALLWAPCAGTTYCYPEDCFDDITLEASICARQAFCKRYVSKDSLNTALLEDVQLATWNIIMQLIQLVVIAMLIATVIGILFGWVTLLLLDICEEDSSKCRRCRQMSRCSTGKRKCSFCGGAFLVVGIICLILVQVFKDLREVMVQVSSGVLNSCLEQLVVGFLENSASIPEAASKGVQWNILLHNPTEELLTASSLEGEVLLHGTSAAHFSLYGGEELQLPANGSGVLPISVSASTIGGVAGAANALIAYQLNRTLEVGLQLVGAGSFASDPFKFKALFVFPLDSTKLPRPLSKLAEGIEYAVVTGSMESGLKAKNAEGKTLLQLDSLEVESPSLFRMSVLIGSMCAVVLVTALICSCVCCSSCVGEDMRSQYSRRGWESMAKRIKSIKSIRGGARGSGGRLRDPASHLEAPRESVGFPAAHAQDPGGSPPPRGVVTFGAPPGGAPAQKLSHLVPDRNSQQPAYNGTLQSPANGPRPSALKGSVLGRTSQQERGSAYSPGAQPGVTVSEFIQMPPAHQENLDPGGRLSVPRQAAPPARWGPTNSGAAQVLSPRQVAGQRAAVSENPQALSPRQSPRPGPGWSAAQEPSPRAARGMRNSAPHRVIDRE